MDHILIQTLFLSCQWMNVNTHWNDDWSLKEKQQVLLKKNIYPIKNGYVTKQLRNWKLKPTSLQTNAHMSTFNWIFSRTLLSTAKHYSIRFAWILIIYIWSIEKLRWPCCQVPTVNQIFMDYKFLKEIKHFKAGLQKLEHFNISALSCIFMG